MKLKELDVVRTKFGTLTVVERVNTCGEVCIVLPNSSKQRVGWYEPDELTFVGSLKQIVAEWPRTHKPTNKTANDFPSLDECPKCGGYADNGFDRSYPPVVYLCSKCVENSNDTR